MIKDDLFELNNILQALQFINLISAIVTMV